MTKQDVLRATVFGSPVAEEEQQFLSSYFVETEQWRRVFAGEIDVVFGPKGSGKSAIYALILGRDDDLFERNIVVVAAENPQGSLAFKDIVIDPPTDEKQFRELWKLYFLILVATTLRDYGIADQVAQDVIRPLEETGLLPKHFSLSGLLTSALRYVRRRFEIESVEPDFKINPATGLIEGFGGKITFREPSAAERSLGLISVDALLSIADAALNADGYNIWLLLDRLDVVFAEQPDLERHALRALFRAYIDLRGLRKLFIKIFLRTDLWNRITEGGFREASHITRQVTIQWDDASLMNLVIRRALHNKVLSDFYEVDSSAVLTDAQKQQDLFYRIFPRQVDVGEKKPVTFDWILNRVRDRNGESCATRTDSTVVGCPRHSTARA